MSHISYHLEAQRRQRVIDKKHIALAKLAVKQAEEERKLREGQQHRAAIEREQQITFSKQRQDYLKLMGRKSDTKKAVINANYTHMLEEHKKLIAQKDLRHQEKTLRDNCLVMGNVNDYFLA
ncbi:hypothetical protein QZH41_013060 [Actinostola sp. cb2023]|nr:hypothetical protein QZH41_013060 [Actinostola sp. cb2023]